ncbi:MAG TPA: glycoside hydrolase family 38 C-terminal domain-containing protein [Candidatus Hydrogenedentes bacterium]|nr:alpha-mannosidase [Candidatus Hydrogenedentota bacterium]HOK89463.1 glycoside hydrolase family 38 C-terminal domain-containing protein [Candidatus Hydrogenedentota bacterium]
MKRLYLLCNAHLDPVWLWEWQEGAAEAISTFRVAADLCEAFDGFIFNHNEAVLYEWIQEYDPGLFARIQRLVREGKWRIMGGWFLQPDCNMPSGESFIRQARYGLRYFEKHFGVRPKVAINFDPFGHSRGLVQLLVKTGYEGYLFGRPGQEDCELPDADFVWEGLDGSRIPAHRFLEWYNSQLGKARQKAEMFLEKHGQREIGLMLWGVGNHGGGPSRKDLSDLSELMAEVDKTEIVHASAEDYFQARAALDIPREIVAKSLNPWAVGCYVSQVRIKQAHRRLEQMLYAVEKATAVATMAGLAAARPDMLASAERDLLLSEFHDILPGSSIQPVEEWVLRVTGHGIELLEREQARLFFALCSRQRRAEEGTIPVMAWNPHPWPVEGVFEVEFNLADANWDEELSVPGLKLNGEEIPCQCEKELSNVPLDWRKRLVFQATLPPMEVTRFDAFIRERESGPRKPSEAVTAPLTLGNDTMSAVVDPVSGTVQDLSLDGVSVLGANSLALRVLADDEDPWGMTRHGWTDIQGQFVPLSPEEAGWLCGKKDLVDPVRVIENGPVRTVVEILSGWGHSRAVTRLAVPRRGNWIDVHVRLYWMEKNAMVKLALPMAFEDGEHWGQIVFGREKFDGVPMERVHQQWTAVRSRGKGVMAACLNNGVYGCDFRDGVLGVSLLRSPAYSGHPIFDREITPPGRFTPRIDQGERQFYFRIHVGRSENLFPRLDRLALEINQPPMVLSFFPSGEGGEPPRAGVWLEGDPGVVLSSLRVSETEPGTWVARLYESTGQPARVRLVAPAIGVNEDMMLGPFEVKTLCLARGGRVTETSILA